MISDGLIINWSLSIHLTVTSISSQPSKRPFVFPNKKDTQGQQYIGYNEQEENGSTMTTSDAQERNDITGLWSLVQVISLENVTPYLCGF